MRFEPLDRPVRVETLGFWNETIERWHGEGLPPEVADDLGALLYFGVDMQMPVNLEPDLQPGFFPLFDEEVIEEDERFTIKRDIKGAVVKVFTDASSGIPGLVEPPITDEANWEEIKWRLDPDSPGRLEPWTPLIEATKTEPIPLSVFICGLFGTHRHLLGFTGLMLAYRKQPRLLHKIARHWVDFWKGVVSRISDIRTPDLVSLWEDMAYRNGPMIGPAAFEEFMLPYYNELISFLQGDLGVPVIGVDTDGKMTPLIPLFIEAGVNLIYPFEVQAGMDVVKIRERWPRDFVIWGGIDKRALALDRRTIEEEVMRVVPPMLRKGGYVPALDHLVPPDVPLENWRYFLELVRETGERVCREG